MSIEIRLWILSWGDQVEVLIWRNPEVTRTVMIRSDGNISLPLLQEVKAAYDPADLFRSNHPVAPAA
jgi:hypothetical protein